MDQQPVAQRRSRHHIAARESVNCFQLSDAKSEIVKLNVRVLYAREIFTRFHSEAKLLILMVARDGIEPPTPAFSGPLTDSPKWFEINGCH
jgi:hypothetical protein